jgi:hypothetical protein
MYFIFYFNSKMSSITIFYHSFFLITPIVLHILALSIPIGADEPFTASAPHFQPSPASHKVHGRKLKWDADPNTPIESEMQAMSSNNSNRLNVPQARDAMDQFKMEAARDPDVPAPS